MNEIIILEEPKIPTKWDYNQSVKKIKVLVYKWKNLTAEVVNELFIARKILSSQGARTDLKEKKTWENYCEEIGVERSTVHRWINRYFVADATRLELETPPLPEGKFTILYADPPWQFNNSGFEQSAASIYPTMSTEEICNIKIAEISAKESVLFLWATNAMLEDTLLVMKSWGFEYKSNMVWIKDKAPGMGWFTESKHELLLIGVKGGNWHPVEKFQSWYKSEVKEHSKKPFMFYEIIERMYPNQKYIELFARNKRQNWISFGNEL